MNGIDEVLRLAGGTQPALAKWLGVTQPTISRWISRGFLPKARARQCEQLFGVARRRLIDPALLRELGLDAHE